DVGEHAEQRRRVAGESLRAEVEALRHGGADDQLAAAGAVAEDDRRGLAGEAPGLAGGGRRREGSGAPAGDPFVPEVEVIGGAEVGERGLPVLRPPRVLVGARAATRPRCPAGAAAGAGGAALAAVAALRVAEGGEGVHESGVDGQAGA